RILDPFASHPRPRLRTQGWSASISAGGFSYRPPLSAEVIERLRLSSASQADRSRVPVANHLTPCVRSNLERAVSVRVHRNEVPLFVVPKHRNRMTAAAAVVRANDPVTRNTGPRDAERDSAAAAN